MVVHDNLRQRLQAERDRLALELEGLAVPTSLAGELKEDSPFGNREEGAAEVSEFEKRLALRGRLQDALADIERALAKLEKGTYGLCDLCGQPIGAERLEALPQATLCMACKGGRMKNAKGRAVTR